MLKQSRMFVGVVCAMALCSLSSGMTIKEYLHSKYAKPISVNQLDSSYTPVKVSTGGGGGLGDLMGGMMPFIGMFAGAMAGDNAMDAMGAIMISWTKGETVSVEGGKYVVVYKLDFMSMPKTGQAARLTPTLVSTTGISELSVQAGVTPSSYRKSLIKAQSTGKAKPTPEK